MVNTRIVEETHKTRMMIFKFIVILLVVVAALSYMGHKILITKQEFGDEYEQRAINQLISHNTGHEGVVIPNRGAITDSNRQTLAYSTIVYRVFMDVRKLAAREKEDQEHTITKTAEILGKTEQELWALLARNGEGELVYNTFYKILAEQQPQSVASAIDKAKLFDVYTEETTKRFYAHGGVAAQIIGFERDTLWGLESRYNKELSGVQGRVFRTYDSNGRGVVSEKVDAQDGGTLITTLDLFIQQLSEDAVVKYGTQYNARYASAIVMDVNTGGIVAMAAYPSFNLNDPMNPAYITDPRLAEEWARLDNQELAVNFNSIWKNFNITYTFEPGSIFKPVTVAAALEENIIDYDERLYCGGSLVRAGHVIKCMSTHGNIDLRTAIARSCNVALMEIADKMGRDTFYDYQTAFGYGERTGIDLPGEVDAHTLIHTKAGLNASELASSSFGQTFNGTPIQAITAFCAIINGGYLYKPYVVSQILGEKNNVLYDRKPEIIRTVLSKETSDFMREAMVDTFEYGTGARAKIEGYAIGGKSGTADQGREGEEGHHVAASFIGYFPADAPKYTVLTVIYDPEGKTPSASYMFSELVENIIKYKAIAPASQAVKGAKTLEDYRETPLLTAVSSLVKEEYDFSVVGNGDTVTGQYPSAGEFVSPGATIFLMAEQRGADELSEIPDLYGLGVQHARDTLSQMGFIPRVIYNDPEVKLDELNRVTVQMPEAWQKVPYGLEVVIRVGTN